MFGLWWIICAIAAIWVIVDVWTKQKGMDQTHKVLWTIGAVLFNVITAIVYYFVIVKK